MNKCLSLLVGTIPFWHASFPGTPAGTSGFRTGLGALVARSEAAGEPNDIGLQVPENTFMQKITQGDLGHKTAKGQSGDHGRVTERGQLVARPDSLGQTMEAVRRASKNPSCYLTATTWLRGCQKAPVTPKDMSNDYRHQPSWRKCFYLWTWVPIVTLL